MTPKRILIVGTMALTITIGNTLWKERAGEAAPAKSVQNSGASSSIHKQEKDDFLKLLGASSDEEVHDALLEGQSLADIAGHRPAEVEGLIELQVSELAGQLDERLSRGSISTAEHAAQRAELQQLVRASVHGERWG